MIKIVTAEIKYFMKMKSISSDAILIGNMTNTEEIIQRMN
jgi:hypothetical protein